MKTSAFIVLGACYLFCISSHAYAYDFLSREAVLTVVFGQDIGDRPSFQQTVPERAVVSTWPMFRHDSRHTGLSSIAGPSQPSLAWKRDIGLAYASPALSASGAIIVASADSIFAFGPDGSRLWTFPIGTLAISSPLIAPDGTIFVGARDKNLYILQSNSGLPQRAPVATGGEIWSSPVQASNGTIYFGSFDNRLYARNLDGTPLWTFLTSGPILSSPAIGIDGTIYVGSSDKNLYALNPNGTRRWKFLTGDEVDSSPSVNANGTIYVGSSDGKLYAINPDGSLQWSFATGDEIVSSPAVGRDGTIYFGSLDDHLYALNSDGTLRWSFQTEGDIISSPVVDVGGSIYFGSFDHFVYALNPGGTLRWRFKTDSPVWSSPSLGADGTIYVTAAGTRNSSGHLYAIEAAAFALNFPNTPEDGVAQTIEAAPLDDFAPTEGTLFVRRGGDHSYQQIDFTQGSGLNFDAKIPAGFVTPRGIEYFVQFSDGERFLTQPRLNPEMSPIVQAVRVSSLTLPLVLAPSTYRMISVPLVLDDPDAASMLEDDLGPYDPHTWRLFQWRADDYREFPDLKDGFIPGKAFFLIASIARDLTAVNAFSVDSSQPYRVPLAPGWTQVGNPFAFPVSWDKITRDPLLVDGIALWNGTEMIQDPDQIGDMMPWEGYFVHNNSTEVTNLSIPPEEALVPLQQGKRAQASLAEDEYTVQLIARVPGTPLTDTQNWLGTRRLSRLGSDALDRVEAPPVGNYVRLSFLLGDYRYAGDFKPPDSDGRRWNVDVSVTSAVGSNKEVDIQWLALTPLPDGFQIKVLDEDLGGELVQIDNHFRLKVDGMYPTRHLRVLVGTKQFLQAAGSDVVLPQKFGLEQNYPNPFEEQTTIGYRVSSSSPVRLDIFNVLGQRVRTLVNRIDKPGQYFIAWDGKDMQGRSVAGGTYFYRLTADTFTQTRKLLFVH